MRAGGLVLAARLDDHRSSGRDDDRHDHRSDPEGQKRAPRAERRRLDVGRAVAAVAVVGVDDGVPSAAGDEVPVERVREDEGHREGEGERAQKSGLRRVASIAPGTASMTPLSTSSIGDREGVRRERERKREETQARRAGAAPS